MIMKRTKQGNILVIVLFIMFVSSLLGVLISQYTRHLITLSGLFHNYYQAYYHAYGGVEVGLTHVAHHGYGYEEDFLYESFGSCGDERVCRSEVEIDARSRAV